MEMEIFFIKIRKDDLNYSIKKNEENLKFKSFLKIDSNPFLIDFS